MSCINTHTQRAVSPAVGHQGDLHFVFTGSQKLCLIFIIIWANTIQKRSLKPVFIKELFSPASRMVFKWFCFIFVWTYSPDKEQVIFKWGRAQGQTSWVNISKSAFNRLICRCHEVYYEQMSLRLEICCLQSELFSSASLTKFSNLRAGDCPIITSWDINTSVQKENSSTSSEDFILLLTLKESCSFF